MHTYGFLLAALGVIASTQSPLLPGMGFLLALAFVLLAGLYYLRQHRSRALSALLCLCFGLLLGFAQGHRLQAGSLPAALENRHAEWQGCVLATPAVQQRGAAVEWRFPVSVQDAGVLRAMNGHTVRVSTALDASLVQAGQCYRFNARLRRPRGLGSPGAQAYDGWLLGQGVRALARVRSMEPLPALALPFWQRLPVMLQAHWLARIDGLGLSGTSTRLMRAILAGDTAALGSDDWQVLQATGTTHVFVVSGLHMGLAASLGFVAGYLAGALLLLCRLPCTARTPGLLLAIVAAWLFCMACGAGVAAVRSAIMLTAATAGLLLGRPRAISHGLALSALLIVSLNPWAVYLPGFWLSFIAVACLWLVLALRLPGPGYGLGLLQAQWGIGLGLMPVLLVLAKPLASISAAINLVVIPLVSLWVPALLACVLLPVPAQVLEWVDTANRAAWTALQWLATQAATLHWWPVPSLGASLAMGCAVLCWLLPCSWRLRGLAMLALLPWWFPLTAAIEPGGLRMQVIDVGQGQAVLVQTARHRLLYDAGPAWPDGWNAATAVIWPLLGTQGVHRLDRMVISHGDNDHAGGLDWLRERFPDTPVLQTGLPGQGDNCQAGEQWQWDGVRFEVLHPERQTAGNNGSCVLRIDTGAFVALLPGDIERTAELQLVRKHGRRLKADWLLAPHHGSKTSSSWPFAKAVRPARVIYSAGFNNRFGHPVEAVQGRWHTLGAGSRRTASCGTYSLQVQADGHWQEHCHRDRRPWWRDP